MVPWHSWQVRIVDGRPVYSASDLNEYLECEHAAELRRLLALGLRERPESGATVELLRDKGDAHEQRYLEKLRARFGSGVVEFAPSRAASLADIASACAETIGAMASGAPIIYQGTFFDGTFFGRSDFLRRVDHPSGLWRWSYEVIDTKLGLAARPYYLLQLAHYSEHVARIQGSDPAAMHVVLGNAIERSFDYRDVSAYYRAVKAQFLQRMASAPNSTYPYETAHCAVCDWYDECAKRRLNDDHLSLVAFIRRDQIRKFSAAGITTMAALGAARDDQRPFGMPQETFEKLRAQAALQHFGQVQKRPVYELLRGEQARGFALLPQPDEGDVFFDMEGDPLYRPERGLEYLFGAYLAAEQRYVPFWATSDERERHAFEAFVDFITERRKRYPNFHVYHYAPYEVTALRRLMGFYGTREREVDALLRDEVFVDLYAVVRQSMRISSSSYSIKRLEAFYGMQRSSQTKRGDDSIVAFETWLATGDDAILADIETYNADDCRSTHLLHEWLLARRDEYRESSGDAVEWAQRRMPEETPEVQEDGRAAQLLEGLPPFLSLAQLRAAPKEISARWLLAHALEYHRREAKPAYWALFDRRSNVDQLLEFDHDAIGGLALDDVAPFKAAARDRNFVYTYRFPEQQYSVAPGDSVECPEAQKAAGTILAIDDAQRVLQIKLSASIVPRELRAVIPGRPIDTKEQRKALERLADAQLDSALRARFPAAAAIVHAEQPRFTSPRVLVQPNTLDAPSVSAVIADLDSSALVVQGPPGAGKTTLAAAFIADLLASGKRVAIMANGHKAIHNLLHKLEAVASQRGLSFSGLQKASSDESEYVSALDTALITSTRSSRDFETTPHQLAAGTAWLFSREQPQPYDYLVIDEAGQVSLADALATATAARNVVLLGDPLQLKQVSQGSHPVGAGQSVLEHLLRGAATVPPERGIFLDRSYRMHPAICSFISEMVYEERLHPAPGCEANAIHGPLSGSGLRYVPIEHEGNSRASDEEAAAVAALVQSLLKDSTVSACGASQRLLSERDILVVSPYNAQRRRIRAVLEAHGLGGVRVGTVDKFQGQEAPVVIYSMATSSAATLPRDMEFLFERNRFNVAISRAQCMTILVCSPALLTLRCKHPEQMYLVNVLCRYVECAGSENTIAPPPERLARYMA